MIQNALMTQTISSMLVTYIHLYSSMLQNDTVYKLVNDILMLSQCRLALAVVKNCVLLKKNNDMRLKPQHVIKQFRDRE